jgi:hypothetical protein
MPYPAVPDAIITGASNVTDPIVTRVSIGDIDIYKR